MNARVRAALLAALLPFAALAGAGCASTPPKDPTASTGRPDPGSLAEAETLFNRAMALREKGEWDDARYLFRDVHEDHPASPLAEEAQFQAAECAYGAERYAAAGELFSKYVEDRPLSGRVEIVEKRLYDIGDYLIEDGKRGLWGLGIFTSSSEGITVLRRMVSLLPTGGRADDALMRIGRFYAENRDFDGAELALDELLKNYPFSEWRLEARFLLAWTYRKDNRGPEYDGEALRRSRAHFLAYVEQASSDPARAEEYAARIQAAREEVAAIDADFARKALARAKFYVRSGRERAALFVLQEAGRQWGSTEPGKECAERAGELARSLGALSAAPGAEPGEPGRDPR